MCHGHINGVLYVCVLIEMNKLWICWKIRYNYYTKCRRKPGQPVIATKIAGTCQLMSGQFALQNHQVLSFCICCTSQNTGTDVLAT